MSEQPTDNARTALDIEEGSGNVFADLGLPNPEERLVKAELCFAIRQQVEAQGWTQTEAAQRLGTDQPHVSDLMRGKVRGYSVERLMSFLTALDRDVHITISAKRGPQAKIVVAEE